MISLLLARYNEIIVSHMPAAFRLTLAICFTIFRKAVTFSVLEKYFVTKLHFLRFLPNSGKFTEMTKDLFPLLKTIEISYFIMTHTQHSIFGIGKKTSQYF